MSVRVRIAPSPTGFLHVGNVRAALFNWLYARHHGGSFIVRIDDTDVERSEKQYEDDIKAGFAWLGLDWDEGVDVGGPHGSYRQSDRFEHYREVARRLVEDGHAYYDDRPPEVLEGLRKRAQAEKKHPNAYIRRPEVEASGGVIRYSVPQDAPVEFHDLVRDAMRFEAETVDDFVILRSDGTPTYHLASTVDDVDYEITHVVRGEDLLSSTPKHILLTRSLGAETPTYAHLPLLFGPDGKKLSKRHGATAVGDYRPLGILPSAMRNFLALLGWSPGDDRELFFELDELVHAFSLDGIQKKSAVFDFTKLEWMNGQHISRTPVAELLPLVEPLLAEAGVDPAAYGRERLARVVEVVRERARTTVHAAWQMAVRLDGGHVKRNEKARQQIAQDPAAFQNALDAGRERLQGVPPSAWEPQRLEAELRQLAESLGVAPGKVFQPIRIALTGTTVSEPVNVLLELVGREESLRRMGVARAWAPADMQSDH